MQQLDASIRKLDASAMVARNTMSDSLYNYLNNRPYHDSMYLLTQYGAAFKQFETIWQAMDPTFSLCLCIPCKAVSGGVYFDCCVNIDCDIVLYSTEFVKQKYTTRKRWNIK